MFFDGSGGGSDDFIDGIICTFRASSDLIYVGGGNCTVWAAGLNGVLDDTTGNDLIFGGSGAGALLGGSGTDSFIYRLGDAATGEVAVGGESTGRTDINVLDLSAFGWNQVEITHPGTESSKVKPYNVDRSQVLGTITFSEIELLSPCFTGEHPDRDTRWSAISQKLAARRSSADPGRRPKAAAAGFQPHAFRRRTWRGPLACSSRVCARRVGREPAFRSADGFAAAPAASCGCCQRASFQWARYVVVGTPTCRPAGCKPPVAPGLRTADGLPDLQQYELLWLFPELTNGAPYACSGALHTHETRVLLSAEL